MGRYLKAIKEPEIGGEGNRQNRQNLQIPGFVSFVGSTPTPFEKNNAQNSVRAAHDDLLSLVRLCGELYDFTEADHAEALSAALADQVNALICFRMMVGEGLVTNLKGSGGRQ